MILVCGDEMKDEYWWGEVERISPEAPVPVVRVTRKEERPGAAANVAANCRSMGVETELVSVNTAYKIRVIARNQQVCRADFDRKPSMFQQQELLRKFKEREKDASIIIFSDYGKGALDEIPRTRKTTLIDPKGHDYTKYRGSFLVKPNIHEMKDLVGGWSSEEALTEKAQFTCKKFAIQNILLTRAGEGMTLFTRHERTHFPAEAQEVYDVTGAGDTAIAAIAVCLHNGDSLSDAVGSANRAAGIAVRHFGTYAVKKEELS